jgi:uncharacterized membrane protein
MSLKNRIWLGIALVVAFALRVYLLSAQSLWNDEGTSIALASRSIEAIINGAARDIHPPLYFFLLHFWMPLVGQAEFAVRFLSVIAGVLVVALTFRLARFFFDEEVAIIAAFLLALSPFQIYYSQETRMYIWVALFAAMSVCAMTRVLERSKGKRQKAKAEIQNSKIENRNSDSPLPNFCTGHTLAWFLYVAATIAALYTHYFAATLVLFENLVFATWLVFAWRDSQSVIARSEATKQSQSGRGLLRFARNDTVWRTLAFWIAAQVVVGLVFLPWYSFAGHQLASWPAISEPFDLLTLLWRTLNVFSVGLSLDGSTAPAIALAFGVLFLIGLRPARGVRANFGISMLTLWALVPVGVMYVVSLSRPAYNPKFLLLATPPFFILAARGLAQVYPGLFLRQRDVPIKRQPLRLVYFTIAVLAAVGVVPSLRNYYFNPAYARDNYRAILQRIDANARDGDGILINAPGQVDVVRYYRRGHQPLFLLPRMRPPVPVATRADVDEMLGKVQRLFAIYYATEQSDPQGIVEARLAEKAFKARDEWHGNVRFAVYGIAPTPRGVPQTVDAKIGGEITLLNYRLDAREARTGDVLTLTLTWRADSVPSARYKVFVHLLDVRDQVVAQRDGEPVGDTRITTTWRADETITDNYGILNDASTSPGNYRIEVGVYRADNGARLPIVSRDGQAVGDHLILDTVRVVK